MRNRTVSYPARGDFSSLRSVILHDFADAYHESPFTALTSMPFSAPFAAVVSVDACSRTFPDKRRIRSVPTDDGYCKTAAGVQLFEQIRINETVSILVINPSGNTAFGSDGKKARLFVRKVRISDGYVLRRGFASRNKMSRVCIFASALLSRGQNRFP